jgi:twinkle protein
MTAWLPRLISNDDIDAAGPYHDAPRKLIHASMLVEKTVALLDREGAGYGYCLPWRAMSERLRFRPGETTCWYGYSGHMKSTLLGQCATSWQAQGARVCVASFEMSPERSLLRMARQAAGVSVPSAEFIAQYANWSALWFYDHHGLCEPQRLYGLLRYCQTIGIDHVVIDALMHAVMGEDDYNGQKEFIRNICALTRELEMHTHVVHHARKGDEREQLSKASARGSVSILDQVDNGLAIWRSREDMTVSSVAGIVISKPNATLNIVKQRNGAYEGVIPLFIDAASSQFTTADDKGLLNLMQWAPLPPVKAHASAPMH